MYDVEVQYVQCVSYITWQCMKQQVYTLQYFVMKVFVVSYQSHVSSYIPALGVHCVYHQMVPSGLVNMEPFPNVYCNRGQWDRISYQVVNAELALTLYGSKNIPVEYVPSPLCSRTVLVCHLSLCKQLV